MSGLLFGRLWVFSPSLDLFCTMCVCVVSGSDTELGVVACKVVRAGCGGRLRGVHKFKGVN